MGAATRGSWRTVVIQGVAVREMKISALCGWGHEWKLRLAGSLLYRLENTLVLS